MVSAPNQYKDMYDKDTLKMAQAWHTVPRSEKAAAIAAALENNVLPEYKAQAIKLAWEVRREELPGYLIELIGVPDPAKVIPLAAKKLSGIFSKDGLKDFGNYIAGAVADNNWLKLLKSRTDLRWQYIMSLFDKFPADTVAWYNTDLHELSKFIEICSAEKAKQLIERQ